VSFSAIEMPRHRAEALIESAGMALRNPVLWIGLFPVWPGRQASGNFSVVLAARFWYLRLDW
jgi:hypothetical protein